MKCDAKRGVLLGTLLVSVVTLVWGIVLWAPSLLGVGILGFAGLVFAHRRGLEAAVSQPVDDPNLPETPPSPPAREPSASRMDGVAPAIGDVDALVDCMLKLGRFALLLRPQIVGNLTPQQLADAADCLEESMSLVPEGRVRLLGTEFHGQEDCDECDRPANGVGGEAGRVVHVEPLFFDRYAVTNQQFQRFVDDGGYEQLAIWEQEALPAMLEFVDTTGQPGPRYWVDGRYEEGKDDLPVVGVSWFEATAFARWCGKRLPTDAEWTKAGAWPVESSPSQILQRRYPWGDEFNAKRANIWGSGPDRVVSVYGFSTGASVGGAHQMIGNVWEWTASNYGSPGDVTLRLPTSMKSLRGGGFDTYFPTQATCHFQSGDSPLVRRHNIGFRLAIGVCDLAEEACGFAASQPEATQLHVETLS